MAKKSTAAIKQARSHYNSTKRAYHEAGKKLAKLTGLKHKK